jgi:GDPmannose 4,6-dehydratase
LSESTSPGGFSFQSDGSPSGGLWSEANARKRALITGITGQDGSYLTELLLEKGCEVHGLIRRTSTFNTTRIDHLLAETGASADRLLLHYGDLSDSSRLTRLLLDVQPDEIYNLGAQSHVHNSFDEPEYTSDVTGLGVLRLLEAVRNAGLTQDTRFYQASSSEMFGKVREVPQKETTPFHPRSPYGVSKVFGYWATVNYRESYGMFNCNGILFNHESPRRGETFVTRKITQGLARILCKKQAALALGNLDAKRDWGYAKDYVEAMWLMLQQEKPDDYVVATGETHSIREFVEEAFSYVGLDWSKYVVTDPRFFRPAEVDLLIGDASKARSQLGWRPRVDFRGLVRLMVNADLKAHGIRPPA